MLKIQMRKDMEEKMKKLLFIILGLLLILCLSIPVAVYANDTKTIYVHNTSWGYESDFWEFVITQIDNEADAPETIHVVWSDGSENDLDLFSFTGQVAHYRDYDHNSLYPRSETSAVIYSDWGGEFNVSGGPLTPGYPVPEAPAVALFAAGLAGIGAYIIIRRQRLA
jgi:hypothetical protein